MTIYKECRELKVIFIKWYNSAMLKTDTWKLLERKKVYGSKFVNLYKDRVELPNGSIIDDYIVVEKPNIVMVVATDNKNNVIILHEYKYGAGEILLTLPAGHKKENEQSINTAKRELLEETGFVGDDFEELSQIYDYPTKDIHKVYIVRAKNVLRKEKIRHEETEIINYELVSIDELKKQIENKKWKTSSALAAIALSGILF